ncbi:MAG: small subunit ribosomal protein, partial [Solirubrobacteraceae bacterium]|nr:small subunit ribosomal protein [Solirubrobacteraceae bacterium]
YNVGDELEGTVTKVVTFGAFVEILDGVEGLVHISELAPHHVENPREIVSPGDDVKVKILEIDSERRRLSLSVKRVEGQVLTPKVLPPEELAEGAGDLDDLPELGLSEEVFAAGAPAVPDAPTAGEAAAAPVADVEQAEPAAADAPAADAAAAEPPATDAGPVEPAAAGEPAVAEAPTADEAAAAPVADAGPVEPAAADEPDPA